MPDEIEKWISNFTEHKGRPDRNDRDDVVSISAPGLGIPINMYLFMYPVPGLIFRKTIRSVQKYPYNLLHWVHLPGIGKHGLDCLVPRFHILNLVCRRYPFPQTWQIIAGKRSYYTWYQPGIKKVPSWAEKGTNFLHKKVAYLIGILSLSAEPISLNELMGFIGYKNRKTFRANYMQPLEKSGWIARTNPNVPFDPEQKYYLTSAGKAFLGGTVR